MSLHAAGRTRDAIGDAHAAREIAASIADPALELLTLDTMLQLDGTDEMSARARALGDQICDALPDDSMRATFRASEVVHRICKY